MPLLLEFVFDDEAVLLIVAEYGYFFVYVGLLVFELDHDLKLRIQHHVPLL